MYPNPADQYLRIGNATNSEYVMFNSIGQSVLSGTIDKEQDLDISGLQNGMYFLKVRQESAQLTKKILIQH